MTSRSTAFRLICLCLSWSDDEATETLARSLALQEDFPWKVLVAMATEQLMAASMALAIRRRGMHEIFPGVVVKYFDAVHGLNLLRNEKIAQEIGQLASTLNDIDVVPVLLKGGSGLMSGLYPDPGMRIMADIDVLIPSNRIAESFNLLQSEGFEAKMVGPAPNPRHHHLPPLTRPDAAAAIELHREVLDHPHGRLLSPDEVFAQSTVLEVDKAQIRVPSPTHQVMVNSAHAQFADRCHIYGRIQLRSLYDFGLLAKSGAGAIDWDWLASRFAGVLDRSALDFHLLAANTLLGAQVPDLGPPTPLSRALFWRARRMIDRPRRQDFSGRMLRPLMQLRRELSSADLRARLARNLTDLDWWQRHLGMLRRRAP